MSSSPSSEWEVESLRLVLTDSAVSSVSQKRSFDDGDGDEEEEGRLSVHGSPSAPKGSKEPDKRKKIDPVVEVYHHHRSTSPKRRLSKN